MLSSYSGVFFQSSMTGLLTEKCGTTMLCSAIMFVWAVIQSLSECIQMLCELTLEYVQV